MVKDTQKRSETVDEFVSSLNKKYGDGSILLLGNDNLPPVEAFSTGSLALDLATGIGGIPRGRITEIYGPDSSGKTTLAQHIVANAQRAGETCAFVDMEHALDLSYAANCGVDIKSLLLSQPESGELALELVEQMVRWGKIAVVVIDSVAALVPQAEIDGDMGSAPMGMQARLMSQALRKLSGAIHSSKTAVIFTNQLRQKIGVVYGNPETTTGGMALKFYASMRLDIRRIQSLKKGDEVIGNRTRVKIIKNKLAPPFRIAEFDILYGMGISWEGDLIDIGVDFDVIEKRGSFFYYAGEKLGQGRENARLHLTSDPALALLIETEIRSAAGFHHDRLDFGVISTAKDENG